MSKRKPKHLHKRPGPGPGIRVNRRKIYVCGTCGCDYYLRAGGHGYCSPACGTLAYAKKQKAALLVDPMPDRVARSPLCQMDETNIHARDFHLVDPRGTVWHVRNLAHFVREHEDLFAAEDRIIRYSTNSRATAGLRLLRPGTKPRAKGTWKGWTWATD